MHMNGEHALMFCRIRKLDSDVGRTARQRRVILAMMNKFKKLSLGQMNHVVNVLLPNIKTDMSKREIMKYASQSLSKHWNQYKVKQITMPTQDSCVEGNANGSGSGLWTMNWQPTSCSALCMDRAIFVWTRIASHRLLSPRTIRTEKQTGCRPGRRAIIMGQPIIITIRFLQRRPEDTNLREEDPITAALLPQQAGLQLRRRRQQAPKKAEHSNNRQKKSCSRMISAARIFSVIDSDVVRIQIQYQLFMDAGQMGILDAGGVKHLLGGDGAVRVRIFV